MRYIARKKGDYVYYSIIKDITKDGKRTTEIVENIGNEAQLRERAGNEDPIVWLDKYVESLNKEHQKKKATRRSRTYTRNPNNRVEKGKQLSLIHISEPTRLLSISYAVFCLKKKTNHTKTTSQTKHKTYR